jgi:hypothetical protein
VQVYEREQIALMAPIIAAAASEHRMLEAKLKHLEGKAAKATDPEEESRLKAEAKQAAKDLATYVVPEEPICFCDDTTPEKLANLLARQGGRMLLASAEGTAFEIAKGRYSETANFDVFLKGHAGDPLRVHRVSRESDVVDRPALSCALAVQPDDVTGLAEQASMRGRGFLARWLYSIPRSLVGSRQIAPPPVPGAVASEFHRFMGMIWRLRGTTDKDGRPAPHWLRFSAAAESALRAFEQWLEPQLAVGEELAYLAGWANKLAGAIARIAGILHIAEAVGDESKGCLDPISETTVNAAIYLGRDYLLPHAQAAFGMMGADPRMETARAVLDWIARQVEDVEYVESAPLTFSRREIHQGCRRRFKSVDDLDPILDILCKHGWLRLAATGIAGRGQPGPRYAVNPEIWQRAKKDAPRTQRTQRTQPAGNDDFGGCVTEVGS